MAGHGGDAFAALVLRGDQGGSAVRVGQATTTAAHLKKGSWPQTELFAWLQKTAGIDDIEMNRTFNNGIGMVVVVDAAHADATAATLRAAGEQVYAIGTIAARGEGAAVVVA